MMSALDVSPGGNKSLGINHPGTQMVHGTGAGTHVQRALSGHAHFLTFWLRKQLSKPCVTNALSHYKEKRTGVGPVAMAVGPCCLGLKKRP